MTNGSGTAARLWAEQRTTIITGAVIAALVLALIGVRVATGGGGDSSDSGVTVDESPDAAGPTSSSSPRASSSPTPSDGASTPDGSESPSPGAQPAGGTSGGSTGGDGSTATTSGSTTGTTSGTTSGSTSSTTGSGSGSAATTGTTGGGGTALPGVTDDEITVVYYWRGDRTRTSAYRPNEDGNLDEGDAFNKFITYINNHGGPGDDATFMGLDFDLHGRKLVGKVLEAGDNTDTYAATTETIVNEIKPMAALTSTGSQGDYLCPPLADAGIHNFGIYDLRGGLPGRTNGYCSPAGLPFDRQMDLSVAYLKKLQDADPTRAFGLAYVEYPSLQVSGPILEQKMRDAGLNLVDVGTLPTGLNPEPGRALAQRFQANGVNHVVMPDGGAPLTFTNGAAAVPGFFPDYYVWPCSGQDTEGFVRLLNQAQWTNAAGLSCYDEAYISDLTITNTMMQSEWYAKYREVSSGNENPPAQSPFVYAAFLPLLQGITAAGPDLTLENFRAGIDAFQPYRYDFINGITNDATKIMVDLGSPDRMPVADLIEVDWNPTKGGGSSSGRYDYLGKRRYAVPAEVR